MTSLHAALPTPVAHEDSLDIDTRPPAHKQVLEPTTQPPYKGLTGSSRLPCTRLAVHNKGGNKVDVTVVSCPSTC